jgi:DNA topoisomerase IB
VGIDAAERRQYGCHDPWRARRDQAKFEHMIEFGRALPQLGERASAHLAQRGFPKERILAARLAWPGKRSQTR